MEKDFPTEKDRRDGIVRQLLNVGIDPNLLSPKLLNDIYKLPDCHIGTLTGKFLMLRHVEFDDQDLDARSLNMCVVAALVHTKKMSQII
jgi:hypothetical protein